MGWAIDSWLIMSFEAERWSPLDNGLSNDAEPTASGPWEAHLSRKYWDGPRPKDGDAGGALCPICGEEVFVVTRFTCAIEGDIGVVDEILAALKASDWWFKGD